MATIVKPTKTAAMGLLVPLLFLIVLLNYVDRGAISIAAPLMKPELGLSATKYGLAVSAFFWIYAPIQFGIGWSIDRFCVYRLLAAGVALWALSTFLTGFVGGLAVLVALRLGLGLGEAFTFPAAAKIIARHVPADQRGMANAAIAMGIAFGPALGTFAGGLIAAHYGWRPIFLLFGAITLLWVVPWLKAARSLPSYQPQGREEPTPVMPILKSRAVWSMGLVHFTATYCLYFAVIWFPLYMVQRQGMSMERMTLIVTTGFVAQGVAAFIYGWLSDKWTRSGRDEGTFRRWTMIVAQALLAAAIYALMSARGEASLTFWMVFIGITNASGGVNLYAVAQIFAGPRATGGFVGIQNGLGNLSGIIGPIATGMIIDASGGYDLAFMLTAAVAAVGALGWAFMVPPIRQIDFDPVRN